MFAGRRGTQAVRARERGSALLEQALERRRRSTAETLIGVALGIGIADALVRLIGTGPAQIAAVVCGAMVVAIALGGSALLVGEAAASALLVVTIQLPGTGLSGVRFLDSLLGGVVALAVTALLPRNPVDAVQRAAAPLLGEIAGTLEQFARYQQAATQIRTALTSVEALSRGAVRALTVDENVPAPVPAALRD